MSTIPHAVARIFSSHDGQTVLSYLKRITLERILPPSCSNEELRFLEGQRFLIHQIETLIAQGQQS